MDPLYSPKELESKEIFGINLEQQRNNAVINKDLFVNIITDKKEFPPEIIQDLIIATITLKYTQSNSICFAYDGQVIGCGADQQSRIHCTRLAGEKANIWMLRQHPKIIKIQLPMVR